MALRGATAFETWLLAQQRHMAAASEAILHEAALASMSRGAAEAAIGYAVRAAAMSPLDENHQALLILLYRMTGDGDAAARQYAVCTEVLAAQLGVSPGPAVQAALRELTLRSLRHGAALGRAADADAAALLAAELAGDR